MLLRNFPLLQLDFSVFRCEMWILFWFGMLKTEPIRTQT